MDVFKLAVAGINTAEGLKRFSGNTAMYEKYLLRFAEDENYSALCEALEQGDVKAAFSAAHALKGVAGNLSLSKLYKSIEPLVEELRAGRLERAPELMPAVTEAYQAVTDVLTVTAE